ncbi:MAG: nucleotidyltransferase domain-containing protein [Candidatus Hydrogenedentes bacterium]|nr:nucleotidyltransferase domain-containing protein [Candidatus Hydrogenedentota bacterium]MBI3117622.1 nucleotidyltransferase domain-containing protein [Candidatus Hydrogenedentota bacterium]
MQLPITYSKEALDGFCRKHHIIKLAFFGSILREDFSNESDVDVLVEFHPDHIPGLIRLAGMEIELSSILGREADMRTAEDLSKYFREDVVRNALLQYAA